MCMVRCCVSAALTAIFLVQGLPGGAYAAPKAAPVSDDDRKASLTTRRGRPTADTSATPTGP
jgi:hypothetical protein